MMPVGHLMDHGDLMDADESTRLSRREGAMVHKRPSSNWPLLLLDALLGAGPSSRGTVNPVHTRNGDRRRPAATGDWL